MQLIGDYLIPLLTVIPFIVAAVNWLKENTKAPPWLLMPLATVVAFVAICAVTYFGDMPTLGKLAVVALLLGGSASGVFDLTKLFGTITTTGTTNVVMRR